MTEKERQNACQRIMAWLEEHGTITAAQAYEEFGILRLSARIYDLRKQGQHIITRMISVKNRYGETASIAKYIWLGRRDDGWQNGGCLQRP